MPVTVLMYFLFWYFNFCGEKKNTEYIIEMRDAAYILRDAGQSSQFRDCPAKCGMGGHPTETATRAPPQLHKTPPTREKSVTLPPAIPRAKAFHTGRSKRRGGHYHKSPNERHTSALYTETRAGTILSSSITGSELY